MIGPDRVYRLLYRGNKTRRIGGLRPLVNLQSPNPYGDLDDYEFERVLRDGRVNPLDPGISLAVFPTVSVAEKSSVAIQEGGPCDAHPKQDGNLMLVVSKCEHYRVGNVLLIVPLDGVPKPASVSERQALRRALRQLGTPTTR